MQESWARLHGWRRRGRMAGGGSGGGLGSKREVGGVDLMRNSWPRMEGSGWGFWRRRWVGGGGFQAPTLQFCCAQGQGCAGGLGVLGEVRVL